MKPLLISPLVLILYLPSSLKPCTQSILSITFLAIFSISSSMITPPRPNPYSLSGTGIAKPLDHRYLVVALTTISFVSLSPQLSSSPVSLLLIVQLLIESL